MASTEAATNEHMRRSAHRAVDDPAQLARAARIVRAALERRKLTLAELTPLPAAKSARSLGKKVS